MGAAYSQSAWLVHYLEKKHGVKAIHGMLDAFSDGKDTEAALQEAIGQSSVTFEDDAWRWCSTQAPRAWSTKIVRYDREGT